MQQPSLSKSSPSSPPQAAARADWDPGYSVGWRYAGDGFAVADWSCDGVSKAAGGEEEIPGWIEINLQRCGWHVRRACGRTYFVDPLHFSLWPQGVGFRLSQNTGRPQSATLLFLRGAAMEEILADVQGASGRSWNRLAASPSMFRSDAVAVDHARLLSIPIDQGLRFEECTLGLLRSFLSAAIDSAEKGPRRTTQRERNIVLRARDFVACHYTEALSIALIAKAAAVSASRLSTLFPRVTGISIWRYVQGLRLQRALNALASRGQRPDLASLAMDLGFNSHSHFTQAFRKRFGLLPSEFASQPPLGFRLRRAR